MKKFHKDSPPAGAIEWPPAPDELSLEEGEVHVWAALLDVAPELRSRLASSLSAGERERAGQFKFERLRNYFVTGRGLQRDLLGRYLQRDPAELELVEGPRGKPALAAKFAEAGIHFNLTHSMNLALIAVTRAGPVGVDVERVRPVQDAAELVARFFSPQESELFGKIAAPGQPAAFFNLWTRKEAMLKATGEGITGSLSRMEVTFLPGEPARVIRIAGDTEAAAQWSLQELSPANGFVGAVAVRTMDLHVRCWKVAA